MYRFKIQLTERNGTPWSRGSGAVIASVRLLPFLTERRRRCGSSDRVSHSLLVFRTPIAPPSDDRLLTVSRSCAILLYVYGLLVHCATATLPIQEPKSDVRRDILFLCPTSAAIVWCIEQ